MLALDRLSQKKNKSTGGHQFEGTDEERDMAMLIEGETDGMSDGQVNGLYSLILRLKLDHGEEDVRRGRWDERV